MQGLLSCRDLDIFYFLFFSMLYLAFCHAVSVITMTTKFKVFIFKCTSATKRLTSIYTLSVHSVHYKLDLQENIHS